MRKARKMMPARITSTRIDRSGDAYVIAFVTPAIIFTVLSTRWAATSAVCGFASIVSRIIDTKSRRDASTHPDTSEMNARIVSGMVKSGFRAIDWNVSFGEKKTPTMRANELTFSGGGG